MGILRGDASEIYALAGDLAGLTFKVVPAARAAMDQAGRDFAATWAENVRDTLTGRGAKGKGGSHAWAYPDSIDSELTFGISNIAVDVGPNVDKKQGFLGRILENGGERSPAYLHGLKALETIEPHAEALIASAIGGTFAATPVANPNELVEYTTKAGVTRSATRAQVANWTRGSSR